MAEVRVGEARKAETIDFEGVTPILRVGSLAASLEYYVKVLGFKVDWQDPGIIASVSRGRCHIMLSEGDQGHAGGWVWIGVDAIEPLFEEYRAAGAKLRHAPTNYSWAYEMQIEDIDGNVLRMGAEPKDGVPMGEWLDARGQVWVKSATGEWTRKDATN
jgi:catechol 2,3-dioxygenase-like lactoylglutathione lyase family enzyme